MKLDNAKVRQAALQLGFDLVGFAKAEPLADEAALLKEWLAKGRHAGMEYMERNFEKRKDVTEILPSAKSVISLGMNYYTADRNEAPDDSGRVSLYARGKDYHLIIWEKLDQLKDKLREIEPGFEAVSYVDTGPVMDKAWAVKAGLGWLGKNTNILNKQIGSYFFIAEIICNGEFDYSEEVPDHCGACTRCLEACPTDALTETRQLDANKCISYLTIENKGDIPQEFKGKFKNYIFGCDICQEVCPWNIKFARETRQKEFRNVIAGDYIKFNEIENLTNSRFRKKFSGSPVIRTKLKGLKRNTEFIKE